MRLFNQKERKTSEYTLVSLLVANLAILIIAVLRDWRLFDLLFIFWLENVIIGIFTIFKIIMAQKRTENQNRSPLIEVIVKMVLVPFFILHFYGFCAIHGIFILLLFGNLAAGTSTDNIPELFSMVVNRSSALIGAATLFISHAISFFVHYIGKKEYHTTNPGNAMISPYKRILLVQVVILGGAFIIANYGPSSVLLMILFFILKTATDGWRHLVEHKTKNRLP
jgi:hypothetical protein